jgi:DNA-binding response OmpR family regulator
MKSKSIFLAEDDFIIALDLKSILCKNGFQNITCFSNGDKLLNNALSQPPDLIIADILLANNTNGSEAIKKLWQQVYVPVLFISALNVIKFKSQFDASRCVFLSKPFKESELLTSIELLLNNPS